MPPAAYDLADYGLEHFGSAKLGDKRRTKSLVDLANRLSRQPRGSLPEKFKDPNATRRCYDLMNTDAVTHAAVLRPHALRTASLLLEQRGVALCLEDTSELDFTSHKSLHSQLGQIGDGNGRGYECHNNLVVLPQDRRVLGLLAQQLHRRADVPKGETPAQRRERKDRESLLWPHGAAAVNEVIKEACQQKGLSARPDGLRLVRIFDRGGDSFEFLDKIDADKDGYVARSKHNRNIRVGHDVPGQAAEPGSRAAEDAGQTVKLHDYLRTLPFVGASREIKVRSHDGGPSREATVVMSWAAVTLLVPQQQCGFSRRVPLLAWAIRVWEPNPPAGAERVEWFLLTNVAVAVVADAWERVDWYCLRWIVEEFHKAQQTGCNIEDPQFETVEALQPMIALLSVVAVSLLNLRDMSRNKETQDQPATVVASPLEVEVLSGWRYKTRRMLTVKEYFLALARLGGHQNRRKDLPPGWIVLWRGWQALQLMVDGARAARAPNDPIGSPDEP
jgi:Transposase DNA-binding